MAPEPGESLASWIDRLGEDMRCPPGLVADDLDLRVVPGAVQRPLSLLFGITATDEQKASFGRPPGVSAEVFDGMHLSVYDGTMLDLSDLAEDKASVQRVWFREWALFTTSRACPACLAESGGVWMLWWRLAAAAGARAVAWNCGAVLNGIRASRRGSCWSSRRGVRTGLVIGCAGIG